jgi:hypothetical protein
VKDAFCHAVLNVTVVDLLPTRAPLLYSRSRSRSVCPAASALTHNPSVNTPEPVCK